jgi:hypothetical protein
MNAAEMTIAMLTARAEIDGAFDEYRAAILEDADADRAAKLAMATSYVTVKSQIEGRPTVAEVEARVDQATADVQHRARLAEGRKRAAHLNVQYRQGVLSSLQSLASLTKAEAQIAAYEPREVQSA